MTLNKLVFTKGEERLVVIQFHEHEFEDLRSAFSLATRLADKEHRDSPQFRRALHKMNRRLSTMAKDILNREKQRFVKK